MNIDLKDIDPIRTEMAVKEMVVQCHGLAKHMGWWTDLATGKDLTAGYVYGTETGQIPPRNIGETIALIHSELSEALEGARKSRMDEHLPHRTSLEVELADALIRICDMAGGFGLDLGGAVAEKLSYNARRPDHRVENRRQSGGKAF